MRFRLLLLLAWPALALADPPEITGVEATASGSGWRFDVTIAHPDTGWDHYADGWRVELEDGTVLGFRELFHPHVEEQPFTRSLSGVVIPDGVTRVFLRARDNVDGWNEATLPYDLPAG